MEFAASPNLAVAPATSLIKVRLSLLGQLSDVRFQIPNIRLAEAYKPDTVQARRSLGHQLWQSFLNLVIILTTVTIFTWFGPSVVYEISQGWERIMPPPTKTQNVSQIVSTVPIQAGLPGYLQKFNQWVGGLAVTPVAGQSATEPKVVQPLPTLTPVKYQPTYDSTLPDGNWLIIPRIGVRSELQKNPDFETALERGLWQVPDFGEPGSAELPMIVAGHRYGWDWWWKSNYWKYNSFYLLPSLQPGDRVEVIADHRKWLYEIYAAEEGSQITDYSGDLILYTCKHLQSPIRFFRYAKLVDPTLNSQK